MRVVERPLLAPHHCAAIPFIGQSAVNQRWVDTGTTMECFEGRVYLSETSIRQCWELLGLPAPRYTEDLERRVVEAEDAAIGLLIQVERMEAQIGAVETLRVHFGVVAA